MRNVLENSPIWSLDFTPKGQYLCASCTEYGFAITDPKRGLIIKRIKDRVHSFTFIDNGRVPQIAIGVESKEIFIRG